MTKNLFNVLHQKVQNVLRFTIFFNFAFCNAAWILQSHLLLYTSVNWRWCKWPKEILSSHIYDSYFEVEFFVFTSISQWFKAIWSKHKIKKNWWNYFVNFISSVKWFHIMMNPKVMNPDWNLKLSPGAEVL